MSKITELAKIRDLVNEKRKDGILFYFGDAWTITTKDNTKQINRNQVRQYLENHKPQIIVFLSGATVWNAETKEFEGDTEKYIPEILQGLECQFIEVADPEAVPDLIWLISGGKPFSRELRPVQYEGGQCTAPGVWYVSTGKENIYLRSQKP